MRYPPVVKVILGDETVRVVGRQPGHDQGVGGADGDLDVRGSTRCCNTNKTRSHNMD